MHRLSESQVCLFRAPLSAEDDIKETLDSRVKRRQTKALSSMSTAALCQYLDKYLDSIIIWCMPRKLIVTSIMMRLAPATLGGSCSHDSFNDMAQREYFILATLDSLRLDTSRASPRGTHLQ